MKKLIRDPKVSVADMLEPTEYERWEAREYLEEEILTYSSCVVAFLMLIGIVILL